MPSETLDTLYISFKESGASKIFATIRAIDSELSKLERKMEKSETQVLSRLSKTREAFDKKVVAAQREFGQAATANKQHLNDELGILRQIAAVSKEIKNNIGTNAKIDARTTINETGSHVNTRTITNYKYGKGSSPFYDVLFNTGTGKTNSDDKTKEAIEKTAENTEKMAKGSNSFGNNFLKITGSLFALAKGTMAFYNQTMGEQKALAQWSTAKSLSAFSGNSAENAFANLAQFGGGRMDAISSDRNISTSLGRLAYGDTSLIQSLGMFGIGGITPRSTPQEIRQKVIDRLKRGDMGINQVNALFSALPYSDAEKMAIRNSVDIYKGNANALNISENGKRQLTNDALGDLNVEKGKQAFNDSELGKKITDLINHLKKESPLVVALDKLTIPIETIASSWIIKGIFSSATDAAGTAVVSALPRTMGGLLAPIKKWGLKAFGLGSILMSPNTAGDAERDRMAGFSEQLKNVNWGAWDIPNSTINNTNSNNTTTNNYNFYQGKTNAELAEEGALIYSRILDNSGF